MSKNNMNTTNTTASEVNEAKELAKKLRAIALVDGLKYEQIAERSGLSLTTIESIMYGRYNVGYKQLSKVINAMGYELTFTKRP